MDKQLQDKAIKFKGQDYVMVKDRILYLANNYEWKYSIDQDYQYFPESKMRVVKTTLEINGCKYVWLAQEIEWTTFINKTSALENASTSSIGRAIALIWVWVIDSIASIDEINKANNRANTKPTFWEKEFQNLVKEKDQHTFDEVFKTIQDKYILWTEYTHKVMDLYWKGAWDLF